MLDTLVSLLSVLFFFFFLRIRRPPRSTLFPTRRSSDLVGEAVGSGVAVVVGPSREGRTGESEACTRRFLDRKSTRLNSSHVEISYAVFCLKKKTHYRR